MAKILLVEDDTNLSEIYQARMEAEGYTVVAASDGESALALAAKEKPDLILSDVMMPKISGFEMLDILRNTEGLKDTKVIMLTALGQAEDRTRAESLGADKYLVKSQVTLEDIVSAAQQLLAQVTGQPAAAPAVAAPEPAPAIQVVNAEPPKAAPASPLAATAPAEITTAAVSPVSEPALEPVAPLAPTSFVPAVATATPTVPTTTAASSSPAEPTTVSAPTPYSQTVAATTDNATTNVVQPASDMSSDTEVADDQPIVTESAMPTVAEPSIEFPIATAEPAMPQAIQPEPVPTSIPAATPTTEVAPLTESIGAGTAMEPASIEQPPAVAPPAPEPELPTAITSPEVLAPEPTPALTVASMPVHDPAQTALSEVPVEPTPPANQPLPPQQAVPAPIPAPAAPVPEQTAAPAIPAPEASHPAAIDESVVANAIDKLLAKASSTANAEADITPGSAGDGQHKKIIAPIEHAPQASLQELLAKEAAKENGAFISPEPAAEPFQPAMPDMQLGQQPANLDEAAAAELLAQAQASTIPAAETSTNVAPVPIAVEPEPASPTNPTPVASDAKKGFDPNSIAL